MTIFLLDNLIHHRHHHFVIIVSFGFLSDLDMSSRVLGLGLGTQVLGLDS